VTFPHHGEGSDTQTIDDTQGNGSNNTGNQSLAEEPSTGDNQQQQSNDPPYAKYLNELPESVRPLVEPHYKAWDADVTKKFQSLHSEYEPYKPLFDEYEPDALQDAVQLIQTLEADPKGFLERLQAVYGSDNEQGSADQSNEPEEPESNSIDPRYAQLEQLVQVMAEQMLNQRQQTEEQQYQEQLDSVLSQLHTDHGDFDDNYVLTLISQGVEPEEAVKHFNNAVTAYATKLQAPAANAPTVIGAGGGYPSQAIDPGKLDNKSAKDLVIQMLAQSAAEDQ
jgi:hypothetical protein